MYYNSHERKNRANRREHGGISFELAALVFEDPCSLLLSDRVDETGELRWHTLGQVRLLGEKAFVLLVVHAYRENRDGEETVRIISARPATKLEVARYREQEME